MIGLRGDTRKKRPEREDWKHEAAREKGESKDRVCQDPQAHAAHGPRGVRANGGHILCGVI
jgi:hypothetical protein